MEDIKGLFIIGNKRSGSTQLMRLLNLHPNIFISNETDILWILYHFHNDIDLLPYKHDSPTGMNESLKIAINKLDKNTTVLNNFINYQRYIMSKGFLRGKSFVKKNLIYIGDQKPYQNADPEIMRFALNNFQNIKFIHLTRHPFLVTSSSKKFLDGNNDIWSDLNDRELLDKWIMHEKNVLEAIEKYDLDFIRVKYEDMISNPSSFMSSIYDFLDLSYNKNDIKKANEITKKNYKPIVNYETYRELIQILDLYNYKHSFNIYESYFKPLGYKYYNKILNKIRIR